MVILLLGPAGAGKSTVGRALSADLGWPFVDSDDYVEVHHAAARALERREHLVVACSGLTARDRQIARGGLRVRIVYLKAPRQLIEDRLERRLHTAAASDLHRQLLELEEPGEDSLVVDASRDVPAVVGEIKREFGL
jgi:gluconokinase